MVFKSCSNFYGPHPLFLQVSRQTNPIWVFGHYAQSLYERTQKDLSRSWSYPPKSTKQPSRPSIHHRPPRFQRVRSVVGSLHC